MSETTWRERWEPVLERLVDARPFRAFVIRRIVKDICVVNPRYVSWNRNSFTVIGEQPPHASIYTAFWDTITAIEPARPTVAEIRAAIEAVPFRRFVLWRGNGSASISNPSYAAVSHDGLHLFYACRITGRNPAWKIAEIDRIEFEDTTPGPRA